VYVTHDQLEAMSMADTIAVMNQGVIEQLAPPQEIYDRPASLFVADFIGSPSMNLLSFAGRVARGDRSVRLGGAEVAVPELREDGAEGELVLGVRPEHVRFDDASGLRATVVETEYLGTTQIAIVTTAGGASLKARLPSGLPVRAGDQVGLAFRGERLSLFERATGRALRTRLHDEGDARG
jgi:multiple sugar transport system ATP-binding protein